MSISNPSLRASAGRTFFVALWVLGVVGVAELTALATGLVRRSREASRPAGKIDVAHFQPRPQPIVAPEENEEGLNVSEPLGVEPSPLAVEEPATPAPPPTSAPRPGPPAKPTPVPAEKLATESQGRVQELVAQGRQQRERGDMNSAMTRFREAMAMEPRDPAPIAELAQTFEKMGLGDRAAEQWRRIFEMGEGAGIYFAAAEGRMKLSHAQALVATAPAVAPSVSAEVSSTRKDAAMGLGEITREDGGDLQGGEKFSLRAPLRARAGLRVDVRDVVVQVLFYDVVGERTVTQTSAEVSYAWASPPADWAEGDEEALLAEYLQHAPEPRARDAESRKFHGYIVRLYYKNELQDLRAEPQKLAAQFPATQIFDPAKAQ